MKKTTTNYFVSMLFLVASLSSVFCTKEICNQKFETPCSIQTVQELVKNIVRNLTAATNMEEVNQIYNNVNYGDMFHLEGGFYAVVTYIDHYIAHGNKPELINQTYDSGYREAAIVADPNLITMQYYGGVAGGTWQTYLHSSSLLMVPQLKRTFCLGAKLFNGQIVSVSSGYSKVDPKVGTLACNPSTYQPCSTAAAEVLTNMVWAHLVACTSESDFLIHLNDITHRTNFTMQDGFTVFVVNVSDSHRFVASGEDETNIGLTWSEVAKKDGATTTDNLDEFIARHYHDDSYGDWIEFPWIGSSRGSYDKDIFIAGFTALGNAYYVGCAIRNPTPYIVYTAYSTDPTLLALAYAMILVVGSVYVVQAGVIFYHRKSTLIRMSSPILVFTSLFGGLILTAASILYFLFPSDGTTNVCTCRAWLIPIGLSFMINPILVKTYRVSILLSSMKKTGNMKGGFVAALTALLFLPPLLILAATSGETMASYLTVDPFTEAGPHVNLLQCQDHFERYIPLILWYFVLTCVCFYLAYKVRDAPDGFNEASYIYTACSFLLAYNVLIVPIQFLLTSSPSALEVLRGFGAVLGSFVFTGAITLPKMYHIYKGDHDSPELKKLQTIKNSSASVFSSKLKSPFPNKVGPEELMESRRSTSAVVASQA